MRSSAPSSVLSVFLGWPLPVGWDRRGPPQPWAPIITTSDRPDCNKCTTIIRSSPGFHIWQIFNKNIYFYRLHCVIYLWLIYCILYFKYIFSVNNIFKKHILHLLKFYDLKCILPLEVVFLQLKVYIKYTFHSLQHIFTIQYITLSFYFSAFLAAKWWAFH